MLATEGFSRLLSRLAQLQSVAGVGRMFERPLFGYDTDVNAACLGEAVLAQLAALITSSTDGRWNGMVC